MTRRKTAWIWMILLTILAGCTSLRSDAEVSRDQWEPDTGSANAAR
jgi:hypothetical protein